MYLVIPFYDFCFRLTNESIEQLVGKENGSTDEILAKLTNQGVIDDLIGALRGMGDQHIVLKISISKEGNLALQVLKFLVIVFFLNTVKTPIKRPAYFHSLDEMSLNCELSLNYNISIFKTFCGIFSFQQAIITIKLAFKSCETEKTLIGSTFQAKTLYSVF